MSQPVEIRGYCPACGHGSLVVRPAPFGAVPVKVSCCWPDCPHPDMVHEILQDRETEHIVTLTETGFTLRHPLRERLGDALMECTVHDQLAAHDGPPASTGRYRVVAHCLEYDGIEMTFERMDDHGPSSRPDE